MGRMAVIEVKNLKKHFVDLSVKGRKVVKAVDDISFDVKKGEIFGFLGPNGAGKTTTIRCLMDFVRPTEGEIKLFGEDSKHNAPVKSKIGYLSGNVQLYGKWTGRDHIKFVEGIRGKSGTANDLAKRLNFNLDKKFKHLSSGNQQKLGLILALMGDPELLVMDEPTVGLDPLLQNTIYEILEELKDKGTTIFMSSHNLPEVERMCDRVGIIKEGKLVGVETIAALGEKRLRRVEVRFDDKFNKSDFKFNGVEKVEEVSDGLILTVRGDINPVIKKIATHKLHDLEITHASLEDVFMEFYQSRIDSNKETTRINTNERGE